MNITYYISAPLFEMANEVERDKSIEISMVTSITAGSIQCIDMDNKSRIVGELIFHKGIETYSTARIILRQFFMCFDQLKYADIKLIKNKTHQLVYLL